MMACKCLRGCVHVSTGWCLRMGSQHRSHWVLRTEVWHIHWPQSTQPSSQCNVEFIMLTIEGFKYTFIIRIVIFMRFIYWTHIDTSLINNKVEVRMVSSMLDRDRLNLLGSQSFLSMKFSWWAQLTIGLTLGASFGGSVVLLECLQLLLPQSSLMQLSTEAPGTIISLIRSAGLQGISFPVLSYQTWPTHVIDS